MISSFCEHNQPDEVRSERVRSLLEHAVGEARTPTGTPVWRALHDLFLTEARLRGAGLVEEAWLGLDRPAVRRLAARFDRLFFGRGGRRCRLPGGALMGSVGPSVGFVDDQTLSFDVDEPGLHRTQDLPKRPGGSNLSLLLREVDLLCRDRPCGAIGRPALVERFIAGNWRYCLQWPPFAPAGGVLLVHSLNSTSRGIFCALTAGEVETIAADVVDEMADLWTNDRVIAARVCEASDAARRVATTLDGVRFRCVTVQLNDHVPFSPVELCVEFDAIDDALRQGTVMQVILSAQAPGKAVGMHGLLRSLELETLRHAGADGRIDEMALSIALVSTDGLSSLLVRLAEKYEVFADVAVPSGLQRYKLFWCDGIIHASSWDAGRLHVWKNEIRVEGEQMPATVLAALRGKPLYRLFDSPFRCSALIRSAIDYGTFIAVETEVGSQLVNCVEGKVFTRSPS